MTFTEADAENDGLIKREVGREMAKVAQTNNPELFSHFENVAENKGREPADIFGEMVLRALESQDFADRVLNAEVDMMQLNSDEIRLEDVKYIQKLADELGIDDDEESTDPIDQLIEQRIQSISQSPIPRLNRGDSVDQGNREQVAQHMERVTQKIEELESKIEEKEASGSEGSDDAGEDKSIDELFGEDGEDSGEGEGSIDEADDVMGMGDEGEQEEMDQEEYEQSDGEDREDINKVAEPVVAGDPNAGGGGDADDDEGEQGSEEGSNKPAFSSEEATEE